MRYLRLLALTGLSAFVITACDEAITVQDSGTYTPTSADSGAVAWTPFLVNDLDPATAIPAPGPESDELAEVKTAATSRTPAMDAAIRAWNTGTVLKWNDIMRGMISKYCIAPAAERRPDGSFTGRFLPDPAKPFAHPPFAARMMALVSVGQYDGLINAWRIKYTHRRRMPNVVDASIPVAAPFVSMPSYPNEDAVVGRVAVEIMATLYPSERVALEAMLKECTDSRVAAGIARPSDIKGGDSLGRIVAARVLAYAATDNYSKADDQPRWRTVEPTIVTNWPRWKSLETPARPPLLPFHGDVKTWNIVDGASVDPGPPPTEDSETFKKDLAEMRSISSDRTREQMRIAAFWEDGGGTHTPPGHWNAIAVADLRNAGFSPIKTACILAYLNTAEHDAAVAAWHTKYKYISARPKNLDNSITMSAGLPNFPGYTSGHSTFSAAAARVLGHFFPAKAASYEAMALEAAESRIYSCIHVRVDCEVGVTQGKAVGDAAVTRVLKDPIP